MKTQEQLYVDGISILRLPELRAAPVGVCIYCGSESYTEDGGDLHEEHIVPYSINGRYVLPRASCKSCEEITGRTEALVMRGGFRAIREYMQFQSRTKKRPSHLPLFGINHDDNAKVMVPIEDYPVTWIIPRFQKPRILQPTDAVNSGHPLPWSQCINYDAEKLAALGIRHFNSNSMDVFSFARMLAKIGHALAVHRFGINQFIPFLRHTILYDTGEKVYDYVGGIPKAERDSDELHSLVLKQIQAGHQQLLVAEIRLFAQFNSPIHWVVVGQML